MNLSNYTPLIIVLFVFAQYNLLASDKLYPNKMYTVDELKEILTEHEWTLREIVQTKNDTAVNLTLFMLPCEKDNLLEYSTNGTYQISEGEKLCKTSSDVIKGTGTWEFEESEQAIIDSYMGGRRIEKKILELTPGMLKVQFEGEGNNISTLTYFSEVGLEDTALNELVMDNSDHAKNITQAPREAMLETRRYVLIGLQDFEKGLPVEVDDKGGLLKKVTIYPFINSTDPNVTTTENERNSSLIEQARKVGLDYIVSGNIIKTDSDINAEGKHLGNIKYTVSIINVEEGEIADNRTFEFSQLEEEKKDARGKGILNGVIGAFIPTYNTYRWNSYYNHYFIDNSKSIAADNLSSAFTDDVNADRSHYYESSLAVLDAIANTTEDFGAYVVSNIPVTIPIHKIVRDKKGRFSAAVIEAGSNINLKPNEALNLVRIEQSKLSDGTMVKQLTPLAELIVGSVNSTRLSSCKLPNPLKKKRIDEALQAYPDEIFVQTTEFKRDKASGDNVFKNIKKSFH